MSFDILDISFPLFFVYWYLVGLVIVGTYSLFCYGPKQITVNVILHILATAFFGPIPIFVIISKPFSIILDRLDLIIERKLDVAPKYGLGWKDLTLGELYLVLKDYFSKKTG